MFFFLMILHGKLYVLYHTSDHILHIIHHTLRILYYCIDIRNYILFVLYCTIIFLFFIFIYYILCIMHYISYFVFHILYMYIIVDVYCIHALYTICICIIMYLGSYPNTARALCGASRFHAPGTGCPSTIRSASGAPRESRAFRAFSRVARTHTMNSEDKRGLDVTKLQSL